MRDIEAGVERGDAAATLAFDVYIHRLRAYAGAYLAQLGGVDVISFTAGVGENAAAGPRGSRSRPSGFAGVEIDPERNAARGRGIRIISTDAVARDRARRPDRRGARDRPADAAGRGIRPLSETPPTGLRWQDGATTSRTPSIRTSLEVTWPRTPCPI